MVKSLNIPRKYPTEDIPHDLFNPRKLNINKTHHQEAHSKALIDLHPKTVLMELITYSGKYANGFPDMVESLLKVCDEIRVYKLRL